MKHVKTEGQGVAELVPLAAALRRMEVYKELWSQRFPSETRRHIPEASGTAVFLALIIPEPQNPWEEFCAAPSWSTG